MSINTNMKAKLFHDSDYLNDHNVTLILENNILHKNELSTNLVNSKENSSYIEVKRKIEIPNRKDNNGIPIIKGSKKHHILFRDNKGLPLVDIVNVTKILDCSDFEQEDLEKSVKLPDDQKSKNKTNCCLIF